jgi:diguanylate cyclase (GGDEF)-like protein
MPQITTLMGGARNKSQVIALDSRVPEQVVSDKQYLKILQLTDLLARHLDYEEIFRIFSSEIKRLVPHNGYRYVSDQHHARAKYGKINRHSLQYRLTIQQMDLGELTVYRKEPFSANEVCQYEELLCSLVYPLKNALMYHIAITSAYKDPVTNINNRAALDKLLPREVKLAKRHDHKLAMMIMDLDGFKSINDNCGHDVGDQLLRTVAGVIETRLRNTDMLFRYGGDEFVAALPLTDMQGALDVANRILEGVQQVEVDECIEFPKVGMSIGLSMLHAGDDFGRFFKRVDNALYEAKKSGKHRVVIA